MRIDSEGLLSDKERLYLTEIIPVQSTRPTGQAEITKFKKIIKDFFSVFPVCSVREIYSAMHNIMDMKKSAKRLTVNLEP